MLRRNDAHNRSAALVLAENTPYSGEYLVREFLRHNFVYVHFFTPLQGRDHHSLCINNTEFSVAHETDKLLCSNGRQIWDLPSTEKFHEDHTDACIRGRILRIDSDPP